MEILWFNMQYSHSTRHSNPPEHIRTDTRDTTYVSLINKRLWDPWPCSLQEGPLKNKFHRGDDKGAFFVSHPLIGPEPNGRAGAKKEKKHAAGCQSSPKKGQKCVSGRFRTRYLTIHRAAHYHLHHSGWLFLTAAWWTVWSWCCTRWLSFPLLVLSLGLRNFLGEKIFLLVPKGMSPVRKKKVRFSRSKN